MQDCTGLSQAFLAIVKTLLVLPKGFHALELEIRIIIGITESRRYHLCIYHVVARRFTSKIFQMMCVEFHDLNIKVNEVLLKLQ